MRLNTNLPNTFIDVYMEDEESSVPFKVKSKPFIVFKLPKADASNAKLDTRVFDLMQQYGLLRIMPDADFYVFTGTRNMLQALKLFFATSVYNNDSNKPAIENLKKLQAELSAKMAGKPERAIPVWSKQLSDYERSSSSPPKHGSHVMSWMTKKQAKNNNPSSPSKEKLFKDYPAKRGLAEVEAFKGLCYRMQLGKRHPKVFAVYDEHKDRHGVASEKMAFTTIHDFIEGRRKRGFGKFDKDDVRDTDLIPIWIAALTGQETDLHSNNQALRNEDRLAVQFDADRSAWPITARYHGYDPEYGNPLLAPGKIGYRIPPATSFVISAEDIRTFPKLTHAKPVWWYDNEPATFDVASIDELATDEDCHNQVFYELLKRVLIPDEAYEAAGLATISSKKTRKIFVDNECQITRAYEKELLSMPEFAEYLAKNPQVIDKIKDEFKV